MEKYSKGAELLAVQLGGKEGCDGGRSMRGRQAITRESERRYKRASERERGMAPSV